MPDTLIGTDSHTPMINGIGVLAWGVGGLEAESVMFGMPVMLRVPEVVGVRLTGALREGMLATDLALTVTERLRRMDSAGEFVEFFGPGVSTLSAGERAVVANMAPEYGASTGFFPVDEQTLDYLRGDRPRASQSQLVENYARRQRLWFDPEAEPRYTEVVEIDLAKVEVSLAGPRRPQDRICPAATVEALAALTSRSARSRRRSRSEPAATAPSPSPRSRAAPTPPIRACRRGRTARAARPGAFGLKPPAWVKTSFAPGSPTAARYLRRAGLLDDLEALGFGIVGYGCTTCIGNSGPLTAEIARGASQGAVSFRSRCSPATVTSLAACIPQIEAGLSRLAAAGHRLCACGRCRPRHPRGPDRHLHDGEPVYLPTSGRPAPRSTRR